MSILDYKQKKINHAQDERPSAFKLAINPISLRVLFQDLTSSSLFSWRFNCTAISSRILRVGETTGLLVGAFGLEFDAKNNSCSSNLKGLGLG
jgi:hypothetical protein